MSCRETISRALPWCLIALAYITAGAAQGEGAYPEKPIRLIVGFAAGGPTDIPARTLADKLGDLLGQRVAVENRPAAAGMVATRYFLTQPRDGYTLLLCTHFESINYAVYKNPEYRLSDLAPISLISKYFYGLGLSNSVPVNDLEGFLKYARQHPGEISYATLGPGSAQQIFALQLQRLAGIAMNAVPYRGAAQIAPDFVTGRVQFNFLPMISILPLVQTNQAKVLGVSSPERLPSAPQIPTLREQGIDFVRFGWLGVCAAAGTPQPIIDLLNQQVAVIVASPNYRSMTERAGSVPLSSTPDELRRVIEQTFVEVQRTVQEFGLQQE